MKLLTISIAGYNVEKFIKQTLDSLCCKNIEKLEIFVVDDGGKDQTLQIAKSYAQKFPDSIIPVHKNNGGWGSTVNYSIEHATGKYFKLLDGDDFFDTANLDCFLEKLENINADVVYTPYLTFDHKTGEVVEKYDLSSTYDLYKDYDVDKLTFSEGLEMHALTFMTEILRKNNVSITEKAFYTDNEYRCKGMAYCHTIVFSNLCLYHYRVGLQGQSIDLGGLRKHYKDSISVAKTLIAFHKNGVSVQPPFVLLCVHNALDFAYRALIFLKLKDELRTFDMEVKHNGFIYYQTNFTTLKILRWLRMNFLGIMSYRLRKALGCS